MDSRIPGFYDESRERRLELIGERCDLSTDAREALAELEEETDRTGNTDSAGE